VDYRDELPQILCETVQPLEEMVNRRQALRIEIDVPRTGNTEADIQCLEKAIRALHSYSGSDRFDLRLGGYRLEKHPGATTWWNGKLEQQLKDLLGPNRVRVAPAEDPEQRFEEYLGPLEDPSFEAVLAS